jgi:hypothetical protein
MVLLFALLLEMKLCDSGAYVISLRHRLTYVSCSIRLHFLRAVFNTPLLAAPFLIRLSDKQRTVMQKNIKRFHINAPCGPLGSDIQILPPCNSAEEQR